MQSVPETLCIETPPQATLCFLLPFTPYLVFLSLGLVLICSSWFET